MQNHAFVQEIKKQDEVVMKKENEHNILSLKSLSLLCICLLSRKFPEKQPDTKAWFRTRKQASFTVEAAMVMPIFVFFLALFIGLFRVMQVEMQVDQALQYAAGNTALYCQQSEDGHPLLEYAGASVLFYRELKDTIPENCLKYGISGIRFRDLDSNERLVKLHASYEIMLPVSFFGMRSVNVEQSASARKWNGYQSESSGDADSWVYVTPYGSVYHQSTACRYLDLSVHAAGKIQIGVLRNKDGSIYYPCRSCHAAGAEGTVYVTDYGTNYHASAGCSKLKRVVYRIRKEQAEGKSPCKKCYEEKEQ